MGFGRLGVAVGFCLAAMSMATPASADTISQGSYTIVGKASWTSGADVTGGYEATGGSIRGTMSANGVSEGAFTSTSALFSFQGDVTEADFGSEMFFSSDLLANTTPGATYSYPDGTSGLSTAPLTFELWLPSLAVDGTATLYDLTGSQSFSLTVTNTDIKTTYSGSGSDIDPNTGGVIHWSIAGSLTPSNPTVDTASFVVTEVVTPEPGSLLLGMTGMAGRGDGVSPAAQGVALPGVASRGESQLTAGGRQADNSCRLILVVARWFLLRFCKHKNHLRAPYAVSKNSCGSVRFLLFRCYRAGGYVHDV